MLNFNIPKAHERYVIRGHFGSNNFNNPDVVKYFEVRKRAFNEKLEGTTAASYYLNYPNVYDTRPDTVFLVFTGIDEKTDKRTVFGGRRIVFPLNGQKGTLPFEEGRHQIIDRVGADKFKTLVGKETLDITDIIPAMRTHADIVCAEIGAFAIDQHYTRLHFTKPEYIAMREAAYKTSLKMAKDAHVDIVIIEPGRANLEHQEAWLKKHKEYEYCRLGKTRELFTNPFPKGQELEVLLVNISNRYKLLGKTGILRFNQKAASDNRVVPFSR